jgi:hypothetical protein
VYNSLSPNLFVGCKPRWGANSFVSTAALSACWFRPQLLSTAALLSLLLSDSPLQLNERGIKVNNRRCRKRQQQRQCEPRK